MQQKIKKARAADNGANIAAVIDKAIVADPVLEREFGAQKLDELMKDQASKSAAVKYAAYLIDGVCHDDAGALLLLSVVLFKPDGAPMQGNGLAPGADFASLAVRAMVRIETLLSQDPPSATMVPRVRMQYEEHFACALIAAGRADEALDHAQHACRWGKEAGVSGDVFAKIGILKTQCQGSKSFGTMTNPTFDWIQTALAGFALTMLSGNDNPAQSVLMPAASRFDSVGLRKPAQPSAVAFGRGMIPCPHPFHLRIGGIPQIRHRAHGTALNHACDRFVGPAAPHSGAFTSPE